MTLTIIHEGNYHRYIDQTVDGEVKARGLVPRDMKACPPGSMPEARAFDLPLVPESEYVTRLADQIKAGRRNSDYRRRGRNGKPVPSTNQGGRGYCWTHSTVTAMMMQRAIRGMPYIALSAYAVACIVKGYRDEGGWCGESLKFLVERGVPTEEFWPQRSVDRSNDRAETWANAAQNRVLEGFYDLTLAIYNQRLSFAQSVTCHLLNVPTAEDFNFWGHSVSMLDLVNGAQHRFDTRDEDSGKLLQLKAFDKVWGMDNPVTRGLGRRGLNSWGDNWGDLGEFVLTGNQAISNGAVAIAVTG